MARTMEEILKQIIGDHCVRIAELVAKVEALEEEKLRLMAEVAQPTGETK